jgi:hypothetical protein
MPNALSLQLMLVWFVVRLCTGAGWALGTWVVSRLLR